MSAAKQGLWNFLPQSFCLAMVRELRQSGLASRVSLGVCFRFLHHGAQGGERFVQSFFPPPSLFDLGKNQASSGFIDFPGLIIAHCEFRKF
jgi:hypothetical protein